MNLYPPQKSPDHESGPCDLPNQKQTYDVQGDAEMHAPGDNEPEIAEADFFYALAAPDLQRAAAVLRSLEGLSQEAAAILADLLEGNPKQEEWFQECFPYRFHKQKDRYQGHWHRR